MASSPAPATRVETRCVRMSKADAFDGGEGSAADSTAETGRDGGTGGAGGNAAVRLSTPEDAGVRGLRQNASANITAAVSPVTTPTAASAANGPLYRSTHR